MMTDEEFRRRIREDFDFMVLCQMKGNHAMYALLRDRDLDAERARRAAEQQRNREEQS